MFLFCSLCYFGFFVLLPSAASRFLCSFVLLPSLSLSVLCRLSLSSCSHRILSGRQYEICRFFFLPGANCPAPTCVHAQPKKEYQGCFLTETFIFEFNFEFDFSFCTICTQNLFYSFSRTLGMGPPPYTQKGTIPQKNENIFLLFFPFTPFYPMPCVTPISKGFLTPASSPFTPASQTGLPKESSRPLSEIPPRRLGGF